MAGRSYTSRTVGPLATAVDFYHQFKAVWRKSRAIDQTVRNSLEDCRDLTAHIGRDLSECDVVELGPGQMPLLLMYLTARSRKAVGFDLDVVPQGLQPVQYARMLRQNGVKRTIKSLGREVLGFNRAYRRSVARALGLRRLPKLDIRQADVSKRIDMPDASADVVCSSDLLEHLAEPEQTLKETVRVLRPGGVVLARTLHWANANALHDVRVHTGGRRRRWAHLRPSIAHEVQQGAFVNHLRIADWLELFARHFDQVSSTNVPLGEVNPHKSQQRLREELALAREAGELEGFDDEELLTHQLIVRAVKGQSQSG